jgi:hypothetical protein
MDYEEIKKFIKDNGIEKRSRLREEYRKVYNCFKKLSNDEQEKLLPSNLGNYSNLNTANDFKRFIKTNNIHSRKTLHTEYPGAYLRFLNFLSKEEQETILPYKGTIKKADYSTLNTEDDFRKFIKTYEIVGRYDFQKRFRGGYNKFIKLSSEDQNRILPSMLKDYSYINTYEDFRSFIQENNITSRIDLCRRFEQVYCRFSRLLSKEEKESLLPNNNRDYSNINTVEDFKVFIADNNILSRKDFYRRFRNCYYRFLLLSDDDKDSIFPLINSNGELFLADLFTGNNIEFTSEKTYPDLKNISHLRFDFYLPEYNILVEYHGCQHFDPNDKRYSEIAIKRDHLKYDYAKKNNIPLLYFTNEIKIYEKYGYFTEVITDSNVLIQKIKENQPD